jgi:hypothetical protein
LLGASWSPIEKLVYLGPEKKLGVTQAKHLTKKRQYAATAHVVAPPNVNCSKTVERIMRTGGYGYIRTREWFGYMLALATNNKQKVAPIHWNPLHSFLFCVFSLGYWVYHVKF